MVIYFIGVLIAILILSLMIVKETGVLTLSDVFMIIVISSISWITVAVITIAVIDNLIVESDNIIIWKKK